MIEPLKEDILEALDDFADKTSRKYVCRIVIEWVREVLEDENKQDAHEFEVE